MDGQAKFTLLMVGVIAVCLTIVCALLFVALWPYRVYVGLSVLGVFILLMLIYARGRITEQDLRTVRYRHHEETPLDAQGEAHYWPQGVQANPHRLPPQSSYPSPYQRPATAFYQQHD